MRAAAVAVAVLAAATGCGGTVRPRPPVDVSRELARQAARDLAACRAAWRAGAPAGDRAAARTFRRRYVDSWIGDAVPPLPSAAAVARRPLASGRGCTYLFVSGRRYLLVQGVYRRGALRFLRRHARSLTAGDRAVLRQARLPRL